MTNSHELTLEEVRLILGSNNGRHPVLLYIRGRLKHPQFKAWEQTTYGQTQAEEYQRKLHLYPNIGVLLGGEDNLCALDCDTESFYSAVCEENPWMRDTLTTRGERGAQIWFYCVGNRPHKIESLGAKPDSVIAIGAEKFLPDGTAKIGEFRAEGGQSIIRGIHPCGCHYQCLCFKPPTTIEFDRINWPNDVIIPWGKRSRKHEGVTDDDQKLLRRAIEILSVDKLWEHFGYEPRGDKNPVSCPWRDDQHPSFSIYDEGRRWKDHGIGEHGDSYDFYQRAAKQDSKTGFVGFIELAGLGEELKKNQQKDAQGEETPEHDSDPRPLIRHPTIGRYVSEFGHQLGQILGSSERFYRQAGTARYLCNLKIKTHDGSQCEVQRLIEPSAAMFSSLIENYCRPVIVIVDKDGKKKLVRKSIGMDTARRTLACEGFLEQLPEIRLFSEVRVPVRDGTDIVLSKPGYDPRTSVYTCLDAPEIDQTLSGADAAEAWRELLKEFCFPKDKDQKERNRAIAVALAAALTPFCLRLLPEKANRPAFAVSANAEGAGKTLLWSIGLVARPGYVPIGAAPDDEEEMRKVLDSAVHYAVPILFFDNVKRHLSSGQLEAFITSYKHRYRLLGTTNYMEAENVSTVYLTANFATFSPDLRRRSLVIELMLEEAKAEERKIENYLDASRLSAMRARLLSIFWALIKHWHLNGQRTGSVELPSFEEWSRVLGGIVEAAGFVSPCTSTALLTGGDTDTRDMQRFCELLSNSIYGRRPMSLA